jgi:hypothetical protein
LMTSFVSQSKSKITRKRPRKTTNNHGVDLFFRISDTGL